MDKKKCEQKLGTLLVLAGLFLGIGIGMAMDKTAAGTLIGLGVGFLAAYIAAIMKKK